MTVKGVLLKMKKLTKASKRKLTELRKPAQIGCKPSSDSSCSIPNKKMRIEFNPDVDYNPQRDDGAAILSSAPSANQVTPVRKMLGRPHNSQFQGDSLLDLPMDILVKIVCHLHHDDLPAVSQVCRTLRLAVMDAKAIHFCKTPDRSRQQVLKGKDLASKDRRDPLLESPQCPGAPVQGRACIYLQK